MSCIIKSTTSDNEIRCEFTVQATQGKVWDALTTREGWSGWFSEDIETDFKVGSMMRLDFGQYGECWGMVSEREDNRVFAYRWHPGEDCPFDKYPAEEMTTVRFELRQIEDGTQIIMTESGFNALPETRRFNALKQNTGGWDAELKEMAAWLEEGKVQPTSRNSIRRERNYKTSPAKLWEAVATASGLEGWFCTSARGAFAPGEMVILTFEMSNKLVEGPLKVVTYNPISEFSFRWHPAQMEGCNWNDFPETESTLVTLTISETEGGAFLTVVETGFENVAEAHRITALGLDSKGWTECMDLIGKYLADR